MSVLFTSLFWKDAAERAIKTTAQTGVVLITATTTDFLKLDLLHIVGVALGAGVVSLLTSVASSQAGGKGASLVVDAKELPSTPQLPE